MALDNERDGLKNVPRRSEEECECNMFFSSMASFSSFYNKEGSEDIVFDAWSCLTKLQCREQENCNPGRNRERMDIATYGALRVQTKIARK